MLFFLRASLRPPRRTAPNCYCSGPKYWDECYNLATSRMTFSEKMEEFL
jgi:hypothetical protein